MLIVPVTIIGLTNVTVMTVIVGSITNASQGQCRVLAVPRQLMAIPVLWQATVASLLNQRLNVSSQNVRKRSNRQMQRVNVLSNLGRNGRALSSQLQQPINALRNRLQFQRRQHQNRQVPAAKTIAIAGVAAGTVILAAATVMGIVTGLTATTGATRRTSAVNKAHRRRKCRSVKSGHYQKH